MEYFGRAKTAKEQYQNAEEYEQIESENMKGKIDGYIDGFREQIMVDKDEYIALKETVNTMSARINELSDSKLNTYMNSIVSNNYKSGTVTIPATSNWSNSSKNVVFNTPFENSNYSVIITSEWAGNWWAQTSYTATNKKESGFTIYSYIQSADTCPSHKVSWIAIPFNDN